MKYSARPSGSYRRDVPAALRAVRALMRNANATEQVFIIMQSLNGPVLPVNLARLIGTEAGARQVYRRTELVERLCDPAFVASFAPGTVGAAYREFLQKTGYSAAGLAEASNPEGRALVEHPHAWLGRRVRDVHDIWHVLTGYQADEPLGEACLVGFSFAQTRGKGWAVLGIASALKGLKEMHSLVVARAILEGYRRGRAAAWLLSEDYEQLLHEPLDAARARLGIGPAPAYARAQAAVAAATAAGGPASA